MSQRHVIDRDVLERAVELRKRRLAWRAIAQALDVYSPGYLARRVKSEFGPRAAAMPNKPPNPPTMRHRRPRKQGL